MGILIALIWIACCAYITYFYIRIWRDRVAPGPIPFPIIGNLLSMDRAQSDACLTQLAKQYGDIMQVYFGGIPVLVISGKEAAYQALVERGEDFLGRPQTYTSKLLTEGYKDLAFSDYGSQWKVLRRFLHSALKRFGDQDSIIEELVNKENKDTQEAFKGMIGEPTDISLAIAHPVLNFITGVAFGHRYAQGESEFSFVTNYMDLFVRSFEHGNVVDVFPILRFLPLRKLKMLKESIIGRNKVVGHHVQNHISTFNEKNVRDVTDALLNIRSEASQTSLEDQKYLTDDHLRLIINDIFAAGPEMLKATLLWTVVYLMRNPRVQRKAYHQIVQELGPEKLPTISDKGRLPYIEAIVHETLRLSSIVPLGIPRKTTKETSISGFVIPKGMQVMFNLHSIHHDVRYWQRAEEFLPERFIDGNGQFVVPDPKMGFLPFQIGRRNCPAERMSKNYLFLFIARILKDFKFECPPCEIPDTTSALGVVSRPKRFRTVVLPG